MLMMLMPANDDDDDDDDDMIDCVELTMMMIMFEIGELLSGACVG
jgi:hypothetical protein